jgi:chromosome segregation protein
MHLRSITLKGFKSFPNRTRLEFSPGVGVVVGPNGSGKSNITDAVLWALGEQSPLAVRGQTMKDVIFAGGHGVKGSSAAEVEVVIDNSEGRLDSEFSEISILRRLDRSGEGEYRLNGGRCRLADVVEVLSDTGLGKEMHSVVSQGRVESIVLSRPRERRLLIEEAAGLGKHRKRRRRAQLKLERTEENLSRALDVEREARSRLRPLKRQAEAAQLHERLERQTNEARYELAREGVRAGRARLAEAEAVAGTARSARQEAEQLLSGVAGRRQAAEEALAALTSRREELQSRLFAARSAHDRIGIRLERAHDHARAATEGGERRRAQLALLERERSEEGDPAHGLAEKIAALEAELAALDGAREERVREALAGLEREREEAEVARARLQEAADVSRAQLEPVEEAAERARRDRVQAERSMEAVRAEAARAGAELAAVNQFLRAAGPAAGSEGALSDRLQVEPGYETAVAAVLGSRLAAGVVEDLPAGERALDAAGQDGGTVIVAGAAHAPGQEAGAPMEGAERLLDRVTPAGDPAAALTARVLSGVWVVASLDAVPEDFAGIAVTPSGRVWHAGAGELRQAPAGGAERVLEQRNRRAGLVRASEEAARGESVAREALEEAARAVGVADSAREEADVELRRALRELEGAAETVRSTEWLMERRREAPDAGPDAVRRAELAAEVRAERRVAEQSAREAVERAERAAGLRARIKRDAELVQAAGRAAEALETARGAVAGRMAALEAERDAGAYEGEHTAAELRACAQEEAQLQTKLKEAGEQVTLAEVAAQQARDSGAEAEAALRGVAGKLGLEPEPATEPLAGELRTELEARIARLLRRREQLGPVNPLAAQEYEEAVAHVEELETQRGDLESAMTELRGLIAETDRRIRESFEETFEAAAKNFEEVTAHLFPGGKGRLRLVQPDQAPQPVLGGAEPPAGGDESGEETVEGDGDAAAQPAPSDPGVEVEVTPAGKSTKRLSLLSGGEKSLVALAFMFAVFLARPCPFYILDEVEAALDDLNIDRFLQLVRRYSDRAQFIVVTHQKRTMDAADRLYGVSMGGDGVSRVVSRKLAGTPAEAPGMANASVTPGEDVAVA